MNYEENNKLIAEWLGAEKYPPNEYDLYGCVSLMNLFKDIDSDDMNAKHFYKVEEMQFHKSWDWLMVVVEKYYDELENMEDDFEWRSKLHEALLEAFLPKLYEVIVEFITWKNEQQ